MNEIERLGLMDEMGAFLRASVSAIGIKNTSVLRLPSLYQIMDTGVDVVWKNASEDEDAEWVLKITYTEINMATGEETRATEVVVTCPVEETSSMAKAAVLLISENLIDSAISDVIIQE